MRIRTDDIPEEGLDVDIDQDDPWAVKAVAGAVEGSVEGLKVELHLMRIAELVRVWGQASARVQTHCDRCGGDVALTVQGQVELLYEPPRLPELLEEHLTDPSELDIGFYDGKCLEMADILMEQFALWRPDSLRCSDRGVSQVGPAWTCRVPEQPELPDLERDNPFANLRLPE